MRRTHSRWLLGTLVLGYWSWGLLTTCLAQPANPPSEKKAAAEQPAVSETEAAIRKALDAKTTVEFRETPLHDVVDFLADQHKIQIVLDQRALDDAGIGSDTPITANLRNISLRSVLNLVLNELDLTFLIKDEVLIFTTRDETDQILSTVVYDVLDLARVDDGSTSESDLDYDRVIETITSTVGPTTWDQVGGPGSIAPIHGALVISQTQQVHEGIARLLADLRKVRAARPERASAEAGDDPQKVTLRVYKVGVPLLPIAGAAKPAPPAAPATEKKQAEKTPAKADTLNQFAGGMGGGGKSPPRDDIPRVPDPRYLEMLADTVRSTIEPQSWDKSGGEGVIQALPADEHGHGALVVKQTNAAHAQIKQLLQELPKPSVGGFSGCTSGMGFF